MFCHGGKSHLKNKTFSIKSFLNKIQSYIIQIITKIHLIYKNLKVKIKDYIVSIFVVIVFNKL